MVKSPIKEQRKPKKAYKHFLTYLLEHAFYARIHTYATPAFLEGNDEIQNYVAYLTDHLIGRRKQSLGTRLCLDFFRFYNPSRHKNKKTHGVLTGFLTFSRILGRRLHNYEEQTALFLKKLKGPFLKQLLAAEWIKVDAVGNITKIRPFIFTPHPCQFSRAKRCNPEAFLAQKSSNLQGTSVTI